MLPLLLRSSFLSLLVSGFAISLLGCPASHGAAKQSDGASPDATSVAVTDPATSPGRKHHRHKGAGAGGSADAAGASGTAGVSGAADPQAARGGNGTAPVANRWWWPFGQKTANDPTAGTGGKGGRGSSTISVRVTPASVGEIQTVLALSADIQPYFETAVASKASGRLEKLYVDQGARVKAGQVLAQIDPHDYQLALAQAQATLASARASHAAAVSTLYMQQDTLKRTTSVYKEGGVSENQMVTTRAQVDAARASLGSADALIQQAQVGVAIAKTNLGYTSIRAPFDGAVSKRMADVGTQLGPMTAVFSVASTSRLKVSMPLGEAYLASVHQGVEASFTVPTYPNRRFTAKVTEISPEVDPKLRTATVTFLIPNPHGDLVPGMYARMSLPTARRDKVVLLPANAIVTDGEDSYVFEAIDDQAKRLPVKVGLRSGDSLEVTSGVKPGDPVITLGQGLLQDGDKIRVAADEQPAGGGSTPVGGSP